MTLNQTLRSLLLRRRLSNSSPALDATALLLRARRLNSGCGSQSAGEGCSNQPAICPPVPWLMRLSSVSPTLIAVWSDKSYPG